MGFFDGYNVSSSGMSAQRTRINVVSANIANAKTTHTAEGGPYKKQEVVFEDILIANNKKRITIPQKKPRKNISYFSVFFISGITELVFLFSIRQ